MPRQLSHLASPRTVLLSGLLGAIAVFAWRSWTAEAAPLFPVPRATSGAGVDVVVVASPIDCDRSLAFLDVLQRPAVHPHVRSVRLLLLGSAGDSSAVRRVLRELDLAPQIGLVARRGAGVLSDAGVRRTPSILIFRPDGTLLLSTVAPATVDQYVALARLLDAVLATEAA